MEYTQVLAKISIIALTFLILIRIIFFYNNKIKACESPKKVFGKCAMWTNKHDKALEKTEEMLIDEYIKSGKMSWKDDLFLKAVCKKFKYCDVIDFNSGSYYNLSFFYYATEIDGKLTDCLFIKTESFCTAKLPGINGVYCNSTNTLITGHLAFIFYN